MNATDIISMQLVQQADAVQRIRELEAKNKALEARNRELLAIADNSALVLAMYDIECLEEQVAGLRLALDVECAHAEKAEADLETINQVLTGAVEYYYGKTARLEDELETTQGLIAMLHIIISKLENQNHQERNHWTARIGHLELDLREMRDAIERLKAENEQLRARPAGFVLDCGCEVEGEGYGFSLSYCSMHDSFSWQGGLMFTGDVFYPTMEREEAEAERV